MNKKLKTFDPAEWLEDEDMITEYLRQSFESGNIREIARALNDVVRARNITDLAKKMGITRQGLYKTLSENGNPEFITIQKLIKALGLKISIVNPKEKRLTS